MFLDCPLCFVGLDPVFCKAVTHIQVQERSDRLSAGTTETDVEERRLDSAIPILGSTRWPKSQCMCVSAMHTVLIVFIE